MERANLELREQLCEVTSLIGGAYVCLKDLDNRVRVMKEGAEVSGSGTKEEPYVLEAPHTPVVQKAGLVPIDRTPPRVNRKNKGKKRETRPDRPSTPLPASSVWSKDGSIAPDDSISMVVGTSAKHAVKVQDETLEQMEDWLRSNSEALRRSIELDSMVFGASEIVPGTPDQ